MSLQQVRVRVRRTGLGTVAAGGSLGVPFAVRSLVLNLFGAPGHTLLGGGTLGRGQRCAVSGKGFRKHAVHRIGPTAIMLDDLVGDVGHKETRLLCRTGG